MMSKSAVATLTLIERVYLEGNPFECNCDLQPFISYLQAVQENNETLDKNQFQVNFCNFHFTNLLLVLNFFNQLLNKSRTK